MNHIRIYLEYAKAVAERNQYTCHLFGGGSEQQKALKAYQGMFIPGREDHTVRDEHYWWSDSLWAKDSICGTTYTHNARVIALLLAHEMAKTGDMPA